MVDVIDDQPTPPKSEGLTTAQDKAMPVYDISGENPVLGSVPHEDVQAAISSGQYSLPKGREIKVFSPDGSLGTIPAEDAPDAFKAGYQYASPKALDLHYEKQHFETPGQQVLTGLEGAVSGFATPIATAGLGHTLTGMGIPGFTPEEQEKRAQVNPWIHGLAEAGGFGGSMLVGVGEAAILARAGVGALKAARLAEAANVTSRLAAGSVRMAAEMATYQALDETAKIINDVPTTPGQVASNIGLSALMGGVGGAAFSGLGMGATKLVNNQVLRDFADRMAFRGSNVDLKEKLITEFEQAQNMFHEMGSEVTGATGIKAQALEKLMPEMHPKIAEQAQGLAAKVQEAIDKLGDDPLAKKLRESLAEYTQAITESRAAAPAAELPITTTPSYEGIPESVLKARKPMEQRLIQMGEAGARSDAENLAMLNKAGVNPYDMAPKKLPATPSEIFEATQNFKRQLQEWSKFHVLAPPPIAERAFVNVAKSLGHDFRLALENPETWGRVAELQTKLNKAWTEAIPALKDAESKFMTKIGNERVIDPAKFKTYFNQNEKATTSTIRQKMMGNFVSAVEKFHDATKLAYESAGVENPFNPAAMTALKESIATQSTGVKLADMWYDKLAHKGIGDVLGGTVGGTIGHTLGLPGGEFGGAYLGKWALGPVFSSIIKPLIEKGPNSQAFRAATGYAKQVIEGNARLTNSTAKLFEAGAKTIPHNFMPHKQDIEKLDKQVKETAANPSRLLNVADNVGSYMPDHAQAVAQTSMTAVNYLNSLRPHNPKRSPLDSEIPVSKAQMAPYYRQLEIAQQPLMVLDHIKKGTLQPQDIKTLTTIYPDYYNKMCMEAVGAMSSHIDQGKTVPYKTRQSLSLFLGQPLDSTMTPQSIQSVQAVYAQKQQMQAGQAANPGAKHGTSKMGKRAEQMLTSEQSRQQRQNA